MAGEVGRKEMILAVSHQSLYNYKVSAGEWGGQVGDDPSSQSPVFM